MKNYNEMAESIFERRDKYNAERRNTVKKIKNVTACAVCCCLVTLLGIVIWKSGSGTVPPTVSDKVNNKEILYETASTKIPHETAPTVTEEDNSKVEVNEITWLSAEEILKAAENDTRMGVAVPLFVAYQGAIYVGTGEEHAENSRYALLETEVILRKNYSYPTYQIKDVSDNVAIVINGKLTTYQKLFEVNLTIKDTPYSIAHSMCVEYSHGEILQENEDFTVHQAINTQSGEVMQTEYLVDLLPLFKRELPNMFGENENYGDVWWVAVAVPQT